MKKKRCGGRLERSRGRNDWFIPTVFRFPSRCQINFFVGLAHLQVFLCPALLSVPSNLISIWFSLQQQQQRRANKEGAYSRSMARGIQRMGICTQRRGGRALGALSRPSFLSQMDVDDDSTSSPVSPGDWYKHPMRGRRVQFATGIRFHLATLPTLLLFLYRIWRRSSGWCVFLLLKNVGLNDALQPMISTS